MKLAVDSHQFPASWQAKTLGDLCKVISGQHIAAKDYNTEERGIAYLTGPADFGTLYPVISKWTEFPKKKASRGDILITVKGSGVGKINILNAEEVVISRQLMAIRVVDINRDFLYAFLKLQLSFFQGLANGAAIPGLSRQDILGLSVPTPPIAEQKRIVAILDEAFEGIDGAIANTKKNLSNARELFESYLNAIFTRKGDDWVEKKLGDLSEVQSGGTPLRHKSEYWGGDIAWYSSGELNDLYTIPPQRHITDVGLDNSNAKLFPKGSLLIGMYDTAALKMSILDRDAAFNQAVAGMKPNENIDLVFMLHALNFVKPEVLSLRRGVRQKNLSLKKIKNIAVAVPKLEEQQKVVEQLASIGNETQRLEAIYEQKLTALNELKQSILQKAFSGELTAEVGDRAVEGAKEVVAA